MIQISGIKLAPNGQIQNTWLMIEIVQLISGSVRQGRQRVTNVPKGNTLDVSVRADFDRPYILINLIYISCNQFKTPGHASDSSPSHASASRFYIHLFVVRNGTQTIIEIQEIKKFSEDSGDIGTHGGQKSIIQVQASCCKWSKNPAVFTRKSTCSPSAD
jgi:hypothetical protein